MCFIYFGVKKGNGGERREKKEERRKKGEDGQSRLGTGAIDRP
jgi:hypothetical protein